MKETWPETPVSRRIVAELLDGRRVDYRHLKIGDVFRPVRVVSDTYLNFDNGQVDDNFWCRVVDDPQPNGAGEGYAAEVVVGTKDQIVGEAA